MIDDQSEPGAWANALRFPGPIRITEYQPSGRTEAETLPLSEPSGHLTGAAGTVTPSRSARRSGSSSNSFDHGELNA